MWVIVVTRIVKVNTGAIEKYSPRTANRETSHVLGPFLSVKAAQVALVKVSGAHTCLGARMLSETQVREQHAKGYAVLGDDRMKSYTAAVECLDAAK